MTRKDYIALASAMRASRPTDAAESYVACMIQWEVSCDMLADALTEDNARFDRKRFLMACGVQS